MVDVKKDTAAEAAAAKVAKAHMFTMAVDKTVATRVGHTIEFKKGVPTHVPKEAWPEVQAAGAVSEDQDHVAKSREHPATADIPSDPGERKARIFAAFQTLYEKNHREDFSAEGVPTKKALEAEVGFEVDTKERGNYWTEFKQGQS